MSEDHPNVRILKLFDPTDVPGTVGVFAEDAVFHYYNPRLPDLHGDYVGHAGIRSFFDKLETMTGDAFRPNIVSINALGDELVVIHRKQQINMGACRIEVDVVVVWRIVEGQIAEVWDIPSVHTACVLEP
ncbi:MAG: nuclear transport factor 2 family protein [Pseudomonadota bacterium]